MPRQMEFGISMVQKLRKLSPSLHFLEPIEDLHPMYKSDLYESRRHPEAGEIGESLRLHYELEISQCPH